MRRCCSCCSCYRDPTHRARRSNRNPVPRPPSDRCSRATANASGALRRRGEPCAGLPTWGVQRLEARLPVGTKPRVRAARGAILCWRARPARCRLLCRIGHDACENSESEQRRKSWKGHAGFLQGYSLIANATKPGLCAILDPDFRLIPLLGRRQCPQLRPGRGGPRVSGGQLSRG